LINTCTDVNSQNDYGETALHSASYYGRKECAELLIKAGADVNIQNNIGQTALHIASNRGYKEIVELLEKN